ncbi:MAG: apolipoprotein N-acyltransferase [Deltaproteobacteria bacterium]|nr:apolipoprotein N-acyltransferase [Deltaproteobacteria bacterium]TLN03499.1 MAG: apolipoprotein N-acyltransferase [bacterium]
MTHVRSSLKSPVFFRARDYLLAALTGVLLVFSFPKAEISWLAWFAFVPLLVACGQKSPLKAGKLAFVAGLVGYGGIIYWINIVVTTYGKLPLVVSICLYLLLVAYLAAYFFVLFYLVRRAELRGMSVVVSLPIFWVGLEFLRSFLLTGFPWASLGYSQYRVLPLLQMVDVTGVYGISFLIVFANCVLYLLFNWIRARESRVFPSRCTAVFLVLIAVVLLYGYSQLRQTQMGVPLKVALIQGNIDQGIKWDPDFMEETISIYERLSRRAAAAGVDLVVWPESAAPFFFQEPGPPAERITSLVRALQAPLIFGSPAYDDSGPRRRYFNSAFLVSSGGEVLGRSDKLHLVPFGEYVPLAKLLPFVQKLVVGVGDFSPGDELAALDIGKGKVGVLVCFEGIFPELSRNYVRAGAQLLVNITNDGWYGRSSAPYQHLSMSVFRAVENGVPLIRAANTGISAIIDEKGHLSQTTPLFKEDYSVGQVILGTGGTIYTRIGDVFALLCLGVSLGLILLVFRKSA